MENSNFLHSHHFHNISSDFSLQNPGIRLLLLGSPNDWEILKAYYFGDQNQSDDYCFLFSFFLPTVYVKQLVTLEIRQSVSNGQAMVCSTLNPSSL
jgi:hypothetical protein